MLYTYYYMQFCEVGTVIICILQLRKLGLGRLRGSPKITANKGESRDSNNCCLAPKPIPLIIM